MPSGRPLSSGSRSANTAAWSGFRRVFQRLLAERPTPGGALKPTTSNGPESIAERKLRRRQLTEDGNMEISGREFREMPQANIPETSKRPQE
jgi:hypothetical protein